MENIKLDYIKSFSVVIKDIEHPCSTENKEIYTEKIANALNYLSDILSDKIFLSKYVYNISEIHESTNTVILSFNSNYTKDYILQDNQILVN